MAKKEPESYNRLSQRYPFIVAWGRIMGSYDYYIQGELLKASETDAPFDAIYYRKEDTELPKENHGWHRWKDISALSTKYDVWKIVQEYGVNIPEPTPKDTFMPLQVSVAQQRHLSVDQLNNNDPDDIDRFIKALDKFIGSEFPALK